MNLRARTFSSARWTLLRVLCVNSLQIVQLMVLARLLEPAHFSEIAIVVLVLTMSEVFSQTGIDLAIVRERRDPTALLDCAWSLQVIRGLALSVVVAALAPLLSSYFASGELLALLSVAAVVPCIDGLRNTGPVLLMRDLEQKRLVVAEIVVASFCITVGILLAFWLRSVWALVANLILFSVVRAAATYVVHSYRPRLTIRWQRLRGLLRFGLFVNLSVGSGYLLLALDKFVVRKAFGADLHGVYERAFLLSNFAVIHLYSFLAATVFPSFTALAQDPVRFRYHLRRYLLLLSGGFVVYLVGCELCSHWIMGLVYGEKFAAGLPLYRLLLLHAGAYGITAGIHTIFMLLDRPQLSFFANLVQLATLATGLWLTVPGGDIERIPLALAAAAGTGLLTTIVLIRLGGLRPASVGATAQLPLEVRKTERVGAVTAKA